MPRSTIPIYLSLSLLLGACASNPETGEQSGLRGVTPQQAAADPERYRYRAVKWGGTIVNARNLREHTELEVMAYPLDDEGRPRTDASPQGRFQVVKQGYLETGDYAPGRQVTVTGTLARVRQGRVGKAEYRFPVVIADEIRLWSQPRRQEGGMSLPRIHFGIGIGSGGRSSVGVGVGF